MAVKRVSSDINTIRKEVYQALMKELAPAKLRLGSPEAKKQAFDLTIGSFAKIAASQGTQVWRTKKFKKFILVAAKKIGKEARKKAKDGIVDKATFQSACITVMSKLHKEVCEIRLVNGRLTDLPPSVTPSSAHPDGLVCTGFLVLMA